MRRLLPAAVGRLLPPPVGDQHRYPALTSARILASLGNICFAIRLLWPDDILSSVAGYRYMDKIFAGDVPFGLALIAYGAVMTASLYTGKLRRLAAVATWLSLLTWVIVAFAILAANPNQIGTLAYIFIACTNAYAYAHLAAWQRQNPRQES